MLIVTWSDLLHYYTDNHIKLEMASPFTLPPLAPLDIYDSNAADKWKKFIRTWTNYSLATELNKKSEPIQVATLLTVIGEDAHKVFSTFTNWDSDDDNAKIQPVPLKFAEYCQPRKTYPLSGTNSTSGCRNLVNHTINTEQHYECLLTVLIFTLSPQIRSFKIA